RSGLGISASAFFLASPRMLAMKLHFEHPKNGPNRPLRIATSPPHSGHTSGPSGQTSTTCRPVRVQANPGGGGPSVAGSTGSLDRAPLLRGPSRRPFVPPRPAGAVVGGAGVWPLSASLRSSSIFSTGIALRHFGNPEHERNGPRRDLRI